MPFENLLRFSNKSFRGFTLIETLIVIFIISLFSAAGVLGYTGYRQKANLRIAAQQVYSDIRDTQNLALATVRHNGDIPSGGYGLRFTTVDSASYIIFADDDGNYEYDAPDEKIEKKDLPSGIEISEIKISGIATSPVDIVFFPPKPTVYINQNSASSPSTITLKIKGKSCPKECKNVIVNNVGVVETN